MNVYKLRAHADDILRESDPTVKRVKFKKLLKKLLEIAGYSTTIYTLVKIIAGMLGYSLP